MPRIVAYVQTLAASKALDVRRQRAHLNATSVPHHVLLHGELWWHCPASRTDVDYVAAVLKRFQRRWHRRPSSMASVLVCQDICLEERDGLFEYVEGYILRDGTLQQGAWLSFQGRLLDPACPPRNLGSIPAGWQYLGVRVPTWLVEVLWIARKERMAILPMYESRYGALVAHEAAPAL